VPFESPDASGGSLKGKMNRKNAIKSFLLVKTMRKETAK